MWLSSKGWLFLSVPILVAVWVRLLGHRAPMAIGMQGKERSKKASARRKAIANEVGQQEPPDSSYVKYCLHTACDCLLHRRLKLMRMMAPCPVVQWLWAERVKWRGKTRGENWKLFSKDWLGVGAFWGWRFSLVHWRWSLYGYVLTGLGHVLLRRHRHRQD